MSWQLMSECRLAAAVLLLSCLAAVDDRDIIGKMVSPVGVAQRSVFVSTMPRQGLGHETNSAIDDLRNKILFWSSVPDCVG